MRLSLTLPIVLIPNLGSAYGQSLEVLPGLVPGFGGNPLASNPGGSVVVGVAYDGTALQAVRWVNGAIMGLGFLDPTSPSRLSVATGVSADGSVVVGYDNTQAFRWVAGVMTGLGFLDTIGVFKVSAAQGVSADGSVIVGWSHDSANRPTAFRWVAGVMTSIGYLSIINSAQSSYAMGVSADGTVIAGYGLDDFDRNQAFRWQGGVMTGLGFLDPARPDRFSFANAISADGTTVVGYGLDSAGKDQAFRWKAGSMIGLGFLAPGRGDRVSVAHGVSGDGSIVVGESRNASGNSEAFRWTAVTGMKSVYDLLAAAGINLTGWALHQANGISSNGEYIFGSSNQGAWIARIGTVSGLITNDIVARSFASLQGVVESAHGAMSANLGTLAEIAAHHGCRGTCFNVYGLYGAQREPTVVDTSYVGTIGFARMFFPDFSVGFTASLGTHHDKLMGLSESKGRSESAGIHAAFTPDQGIQVLGGAVRSSTGATIDRGYATAPAPSSGSTNGTHAGAVVRLGWAARIFETFRVMPFADYEVTRVRYHGWTESGGPFPAAFAPLDDTQRRTRVGGEARYGFGPASYLWVTAAWGHRLTATTAPISGQLIDLFSLTVAGSPVTRNWTESSAGIRYAFTPSAVVTTSIGARLGGGNSAVTSVRTGLSIQF